MIQHILSTSTILKLHVTATFDPKPSAFEGKETLNDFAYFAPSSLTLPEVPFVQRSARQVAMLDPATRKKHVRLLQEMGAKENQMENYILDDKVPARQYFHSKTNQLMVGGDWDVDSDDDSTADQWLHKINASVSGAFFFGISFFCRLPYDIVFD